MNMQMARTLPLAAAMTATAFVLAGCTGGSGSGAPPPMAASASATTRHPSNRPFADLGGLVHWQPNRARSWMSPDANSQTLLYVSDIATGSVQVFAYPKGTLEGTLTGFGYPQGECADSSGNVYIADAGNDVVVEYAHGGTSPIATLNDPNAYPASCAVDPASGNVAVANLLTAQNFNAGTVAIYPPGSSNATATYADPSIVREYFLAYDLSGEDLRLPASVVRLGSSYTPRLSHRTVRSPTSPSQVVRSDSQAACSGTEATWLSEINKVPS